MKLKLLLPILLMLVLAATRWPGLLPPNFSAVYALMFCAGVYFPKRVAWWLPFATMLVTDALLNQFYYHVTMLSPELAGTYVCYALLVLLGRGFGLWTRSLISGRGGPIGALLRVPLLVGGGLLSAVIFYLVTNTLSWLSNPEYLKTLSGWLTALTRGTAGYPQTWEFFRNTLTSGGLFAGLFAGAMEVMNAADPAEAEEKQEEEKPEEQPEEAKA